MADVRIRKQIALDAAKLMYARDETEYFTAKRKAARRVGVNPQYQPADLPSNREIRDQILALAKLHEGERRTERLADMRVYALWLMRELERFRPKLIGSVCTGHIRRGSDIDIHVFSDSLSTVTMVLDEVGIPYETERKRIVKFNEERVFIHVHTHGRYEAELTVYAESLVNYMFKSSITGKAIESVNIAGLQALIEGDHPDVDLEGALTEHESAIDRFEMFKLLLAPLEAAKGLQQYHPEGDVLYHSLQVFERAREECPWDSELLEAALLHDVGKAIDPSDHAGAGAEAVRDLVSPRTHFLIAHHMDALKLQQGELGSRAARRLRASEYFDDLMSLRDFDEAGREAGVIVDSLVEALERLKRAEQESGW